MMNVSPSPAMRLGLHFAPLFMVALAAWAVFGMLRDGNMHLLPGVIVAAVWGALGTYIAMRTGEEHDLRGRDALEGYAARQMNRTIARTGTPLTFRITRSRSG